MRQLITMTGVALISVLMVSGCSPSSEHHMELAKEKINEAGKEVKDAIAAANNESRIKASQDWQDFKNGAESEIAAMEQQAGILQKKIYSAEDNEKEQWLDKLEDADLKLKTEKEKLRQRNSEFEQDMKTFDEAAVVRNESFKREFKHDMKALSNSFKDVFKDNLK